MESSGWPNLENNILGFESVAMSWGRPLRNLEHVILIFQVVQSLEFCMLAKPGNLHDDVQSFASCGNRLLLSIEHIVLIFEV